MAYSETDPTEITAPLDGNDAVFANILANHDELYGVYAPPILDNRTSTATVTSGSATDIYEFEALGNADLQPITFRVRVTTTGGNGTLTCTAGAASNTAAINGAEAWYSVSVTPLVVDPVCKVQLQVGTASSVAANAVQAYIVPAAPGVPPLASGFTRGNTYWDNASSPIPSELISRLFNGPRLIAIERPVCIASAVAPINASLAAKGDGPIVVYNTAYQECVLRMRIPRCDSVARRYKVRMRLRNSASVGPVMVKIGAWEDTHTPSTTGEWWYTSATMGPGPHELSVMANPGTALGQQVATVQVWRA